jgi:hypothetical protein
MVFSTSQYSVEDAARADQCIFISSMVTRSSAACSNADRYLRLIGQPMLIYGADHAALARALDRALAREVQPALYTEEMFSTTHDAANRNAVCSVEQENLNLVGIAIRAERKVVDKIVDKLKLHQ